MARDIKFFVKDFEELVIKGKGAAASNIQFSLQNRSPFWTGTFNRSWVVSKSYVEPTKKAPYSAKRIGSRIAKRVPIIRTTLSQKLYIGNEAAYAAYVVNEAKLGGKKYSRLFAIGADTSPIPNRPDWYKVYLTNNFLESDIDKGFASFGFKPEKAKSKPKKTR
tara:strand:+ start:1276 stop:1767 length:492 start_codon:yes stop_codon:yes gene_type:complete